MLLSLWFGSYVLSFFGVTLGALRVAGGLVVAVRAWELLSSPGVRQARKEEQAAPAESGSDVAFFPLTIPFTTGPGTISVAIALGANRPSTGIGLFSFMLGSTVAVLAVAASIWIAYRSADQLVEFLGQSRTKVVTRLAAFLLLCIGVQISINGIDDVLGDIIGRYLAPR
jgi:multiple antibiotic resistance protein